MLVHDTWAGRDLPVLEATVGLLERSYMVTVTDIAAATGFESSVVATALEALDPGYVDFRKTTTGGDPRFWYVFKITPEARRVVGQWPTAQALASRLADELAAQAQQEPDGERQGLLAYAARLIGDTLRDATVRAAAHVLGPAFGGTPQPEMASQLPEPAQAPQEEIPSLVDLPDLLRSRSDDPASVVAQPAEPAQQRAGLPRADLPPAGQHDEEPPPALPLPPLPQEPPEAVPDLNRWPDRDEISAP